MNEGGTHRTPTGLAYRWTKGQCGWKGSPIGPDVQENLALMEEPEEEDTVNEDWSQAIEFF